jgi:prepilin-type N-terminal cleavage/methylation domain-containing protein
MKKFHWLNARPAAGFSLIEMMVAITIGIILSIGLIQVMVAGKTASQATQGSNFMQENARFATSQLDYSLQMADHWGTSGPDKGATTPAAVIAFNTAMASCANLQSTSTTTYSTGQNWWTLGTYGISATNQSGVDSAFGSGCLPEYFGGDVVVVRYADSNFVQCSDVTCATASAALTANALFVRVAIGKTMVLAKGSEIHDLATGTYDAPLDAGYFESPDHANQDGMYTYPYRMEIYYIRNCSTPVGAACTAASDNGSPIPTLWRRRLDNSGTLVLEPVVEGIQDMQLQYGLASDNVAGGTIPARFSDIQTYKTASQIGSGLSATDWLKVVSVRVALLAQSDSFNSNGWRTNVNEKSIQGANALGWDPAVKYSGSGDPYIRHAVFTTLGQVRNRDRG